MHAHGLLVRKKTKKRTTLVEVVRTFFSVEMIIRVQPSYKGGFGLFDISDIRRVRNNLSLRDIRMIGVVMSVLHFHDRSTRRQNTQVSQQEKKNTRIVLYTLDRRGQLNSFVCV